MVLLDISKKITAYATSLALLTIPINAQTKETDHQKQTNKETSVLVSGENLENKLENQPSNSEYIPPEEYMIPESNSALQDSSISETCPYLHSSEKKKGLFKRILHTAGDIGLSVTITPKIPSLELHELSHKLAYKMFGAKSKIHHFSYKEFLKERGEYYIYVTSKDYLDNKWKRGFVSIAPYLVDVGIKHRVFEFFAGKKAIGNNPWVQGFAAYDLVTDLSSPIANSGSGGDIDNFESRTGIPKWVTAPVLTALYGYSTWRICRAELKTWDRAIEEKYRNRDKRGKPVYFGHNFRF